MLLSRLEEEHAPAADLSPPSTNCHNLKILLLTRAAKAQPQLLPWFRGQDPPAYWVRALESCRGPAQLAAGTAVPSICPRASLAPLWAARASGKPRSCPALPQLLGDLGEGRKSLWVQGWVFSGWGTREVEVAQGKVEITHIWQQLNCLPGLLSRIS